MFAIGFGFILIVGLISCSVAGLFSFALVKAMQTATGGDNSASIFKRTMALFVAIFAACTASYPFLRNAYIDHLCSAESGVHIFVPAAEWKPPPSNLTVAGSERSGNTWRSVIAPELVQLTSDEHRGWGVNEERVALVDASSGQTLMFFNGFKPNLSIGLLFLIFPESKCYVPFSHKIREDYKARTQK